MNEMHIETRCPPGTQEDFRKAWHAPAVRWLDPRDAQSGSGGHSDGGPNGHSAS